MRFSLVGGMAAVFVLAIGSAAITHPTADWASALFTLMVGTLCWASVAALIRRRAFWIGLGGCGGASATPIGVKLRERVGLKKWGTPSTIVSWITT
jgi:hypothetical protein